MDNKKEQKEGLSRRQFIKVAGFTILAEELAGGFLTRGFAATGQAAIPEAPHLGLSCVMSPSVSGAACARRSAASSTTRRQTAT